MTLAKPTLGRLERVNAREYWESEASDFTPWLARPDNIVLLGETIGLDLEVETIEKNVGPFRADILCRDTTTNHYVLIENQLERTDHGHLGQLLTYAAGLDAASVVWVASRFTDEHRAALDWLNRITSPDFNFFGLEIELWRIGDSTLAPKFNLVSQPNDWSTSFKEMATAQSGALSDTNALYLEYWTQFRRYMEDRGSTVRLQKPRPRYWTITAIGRGGFQVAAWVQTRKAKADVALEMKGPNAKASFHVLRNEYGEQLERSLGPLTWWELPQKKSSVITASRPFPVTDRDSWPELNAWLGDTLEKFHATLGPIVRNLRIDGVLDAVDAEPPGGNSFDDEQ